MLLVSVLLVSVLLVSVLLVSTLLVSEHRLYDQPLNRNIGERDARG